MMAGCHLMRPSFACHLFSSLYPKHHPRHGRHAHPPHTTPHPITQACLSGYLVGSNGFLTSVQLCVEVLLPQLRRRARNLEREIGAEMAEAVEEQLRAAGGAPKAAVAAAVTLTLWHSTRPLPVWRSLPSHFSCAHCYTAHVS